MSAGMPITMSARFIAYPPDRAALVRILGDGQIYRIGRARTCELRIEHASVSRFHAELEGSARGWHLRDTASKNGVRIDGEAVTRGIIVKPTWLAVGDVYCWLEPISAAEAGLHRSEIEVRRATSRIMSEHLAQTRDIQSLIPQTLDVVLELSGLERGFVVFAPPGEALRIHACRGLAAQEIASTRFSGSVAAVEHVLADGNSVICCDTLDSPWLGARPSVQMGGIRALLCVPLRQGDLSLGAIYADSRKPGPPITELDLEMVEHVAEGVAASLAAARLHEDVNDLLRQARDAGMEIPRWDELRPSSGK